MNHHFYCFLPGLLPESKFTFSKPFGNLACLLSKAQAYEAQQYSVEGQISQFFNLATKQLPAGALSAYYYDAIAVDNHHQVYCRVDPIHTRLDAHTVFLVESLTEALSLSETQEIQTQFNTLLADDHALSCQPKSWFFPLSQSPDVSVNPLWEVLGKSLHCRLPSGPEAAHFQRLATECEMILKSLSCNQQRLVDDLPTIDSLWFWGIGSLPFNPKTHFKTVFSNEDCIKGLAKCAGIQYADIPSVPNLHSEASEILLVDTALLHLMAKGDIEGWQNLIKTYDEGWAAFLLDGLQSGDIAKVTLNVGKNMSYTLTKKNLHYFWRRNKPLEYFV